MKRLLFNKTNKKGAILPILVFFIVLVGFGVTAIVVDAGMLYAEKKDMVTAADAGALAGAQILESSKGTDIEGARNEAELFAKNNGAETVSAKVDYRNNRQVIEVTAQVIKDNYFAKLIGFDTTTVNSRAVATWGYVSEYDINGSMLPLFTFDTEFENTSGKAIQYGLHEDNVGNSPPNYGYVDIGNVNKLLEGEQTAQTITPTLYSKDGNVNSIDVAIAKRLENAFLCPTVAEREMYMTGLIPIIDSKEFLQDYFGGNYSIADVLNNPDAYTIDGKHWWESHLELHIDYFAYFVVEDVIFQGQTYGLGASLYSSGYENQYNVNQLNKGGGINYSDGQNLIINGKEIIKYKVPVEGPAASTLIGRYTGETLDRAKVIDGDQNDPDPNTQGEATYYKLIE